jgi:cytochrome P450
MTLPNGPHNRLYIFPFPLLRSLRFIFRPLETLDMFHQRYGDCFSFIPPKGSPLVYITTPEGIRQIFSAPAETFDTASSGRMLQFLLGENSLLALSGDRHQRQRKLLMPPFHGARMQTYGKLIQEITQKVIDRWQVGQPFPVRSTMQEISLQVILNVVFGLHSGDRYQQLQSLLSEMLETIGSPLSSTLIFFRALQKDWGEWSPWGRFLRMREEIDRLLFAEIEERRQLGDSDRDDILSMLLAARDEDGQPMSDPELKDQLLTLLFAGHETTASSLAWALYWLDRLPEVRQKLLEELEAVSVEDDAIAATKLPYLTAICQETLRIYPIAINAFPRIVKQPIEIMGYQFDTGTAIIPSIYLLHQQENLYPEPKKFKPERFLERQFSPYEYIPFGGGDRFCIGYAFAQFEMKIVLATIFSQCELTLANKRPVKPSRRGLTLAPPGSMKMILTAKKSQSQKNRLASASS